MTDALVLTAIADDVGTVSLNDPSTLNALSYPLCAQLREAIESLAPRVGCILLRAEGRGFCSGASLSESPDRFSDPGFDAGAMIDTHINPLMQVIRDLPVPIVAATRGPVAGAGASLALACDIIVASRTSYFLQAFRRIGLVPDGGASFLLTRAVGRVRAMEMMLLGERIAAEQALDWGLITRVVDDEALEAVSRAMAVELASGPTFALGLIRQSCWAASETGWDSALARERRMQRQTGRHPDFREGVAAFQEKRPPRFSMAGREGAGA